MPTTDPAAPPPKPVSRKMRLNLAISLAAGIVLAAASLSLALTQSGRSTLPWISTLMGVIIAGLAALQLWSYRRPPSD